MSFKWTCMELTCGSCLSLFWLAKLCTTVTDCNWKREERKVMHTRVCANVYPPRKKRTAMFLRSHWYQNRFVLKLNMLWSAHIYLAHLVCNSSYSLLSFVARAQFRGKSTTSRYTNKVYATAMEKWQDKRAHWAIPFHIYVGKTMLHKWNASQSLGSIRIWCHLIILRDVTILFLFRRPKHRWRIVFSTAAVFTLNAAITVSV